MNMIVDQLRAFGASKSNIILLADAIADSSVFEYSDLLPNAPQKTIIPISAVVESEGRPILYVVDGEEGKGFDTLTPERVDQLSSTLACRGHQSFLGILSFGKLEVFPCQFTESNLNSIAVTSESNQAQNFLVDLQNGLISRNKKHDVADAEHLHQVLSRVLRAVAKEFLKRPIFSNRANAPDEILALVGRALFIRFLADRKIINSQTFPVYFETFNDIASCFDTTESASLTCEWLDKVFNGELLPLAVNIGYTKYFDELFLADADALGPLHWIMHHTDAGGQLALWQYINFSFVPVGVLSEVYEDFAHTYRQREARAESVHYTPRHIAEPLIEQAFQGLPTSERFNAKVLDPACGAGIFLVLAFRKLAKEYYGAYKIRPDTRTLRTMLYKQLRGFDISQDALKLTALSLYLTAIELDPDPFPPQKLRFEHNLIGSVLFDLRNTSGPIFGSLGSFPGEEEHLQKYDLVVGNPPWSEWKTARVQQNKNAAKLARRVMCARSTTSVDCDVERQLEPYENPDNVPDLPFIWRAMEFAKKNDGLIALIVHGRFLFKRSDAGDNARRLIFENLKIVGILNGADFTDDKTMWPGISVPFCVIFARNTKPATNDSVRVLSPYLDESVRFLPRLRLDPHRSKVIALATLRAEPYVLKTLLRGTELDLAIIRKIEGLLLEPDATSRLGAYWDELGLKCGDGYKVGNQRKEPTALMALCGLQLTPKNPRTYFIDEIKLQDFDVARVEAERDPRIYTPPLVVIPEAPGDSPVKKRGRIAINTRPIIYCESFIGYSAAGHEHAELLARYVFILANSSLFMYYILLTSSKFGVERRAIYKHDIDNFPIYRLGTLLKIDLGAATTINALSDALKNDEINGHREIDKWVYGLYNISKSERQTIADTLLYSLPFSKNQSLARNCPLPSQINAYIDDFKTLLNAKLDLVGQKAAVKLAKTANQKVNSWIFFDVLWSGGGGDEIGATYKEIHDLADAGAASQIFFNLSANSLRVGMLAQSRYWTKSRVRLCVNEVLGLIEKINTPN